ncbi:MAG: BMP family ABC transporter substrate-binding protein [Faecalibacterium sp.]|jgi:basic membrane protein A|nr:BMP family ABC transporter substrate-binding protein [Faecalibacterium sp.]
MHKISRRSFLKAGAVSAAAVALSACGQSVTAASSAAASSVASDAAGSAAADAMKVGYIYIGDDSQAYTANFIAAQTAIEQQFGSAVQSIAKYNVAEDAIESPLRELCEAGCGVIFTTSFGYGETTKEIAQEYPDIQFCQATCADAAAEPVVANYHNYMGEIYQARYVAGIVAGMKLAELGVKAPKIGYVGAFPYAEVISGYTAFFLGVRSIVADATMEVMYANSWGDYDTEKTMATSMIEDGCVLISQHSDTEGPAEACEAAAANGTQVFCVAYNQDMTDIAPNTCLISSRIDWAPYETSAVQAVMDGTEIKVDDWAGFDKGWVAMTELNTAIAAEGTQDAIDKVIEGFKAGSIDVFKGDYTGADYEGNTVDLNEGFTENATQSAPAFAYVLDDVITVKSTN